MKKYKAKQLYTVMKKTRIQKHYNHVVVEDLILKFNCRNIMQLPQMSQIVVSASSKKFQADKHEIINAWSAILLLTAQRSCATRAHKSIASFQLRKGNHVGCFVTLRRSKMYVLLDKILTLLLARLYNFSNQENLTTLKFCKGQNKQSSASRWTAQGTQRQKMHEKQVKHFNMGLQDCTQFPEVESLFEMLGSTQGLNISLSFCSPRGQRGDNLFTKNQTLERGMFLKNNQTTHDIFSSMHKNELIPVLRKQIGGKDYLEKRDTRSLPDTQVESSNADQVFLSAFQYPLRNNLA